MVSAGVAFKFAKSSALQHGLRGTRWDAAASCFVGNIGLAVALPGTDDVAAISAVLKQCGPTSESPLLLLGGVYHQKLVSVDGECQSPRLPPNTALAYGCVAI